MIGDDLAADLAPEARLIRLPRHGWQRVLAEARPDLLLIQSCWPENADGWQLAQGATPGLPVTELLSACRASAIPSVFWHDGEPIADCPFIGAAAACDKVFAAHPAVAARLREACGAARWGGILLPGLQPSRHNPARSPRQAVLAAQGRFAALFDGWADALENRRLRSRLTALGRPGLHIVESQWKLRAERIKDIPELAPALLGCVDADELAAALRLHRAALFLDPSLTGPVERMRQMMRAVACGALPVFEGLAPLPGIMPEADGEVAARMTAVLADPAAAARDCRRGLRRLLREHSWGRRLAAICAAVGVAYDWTEFPRVSIVTPTRRPDFLTAVRRRVEAQTWPEREWIVVVNDREADMTAVRRALDGCDFARIMHVGQSRNIGGCLNHAIAESQGEFWAKMDDDDDYGPEYLSDVVHPLHYFGADVSGKAPGFVFLEEDGVVYRQPRVTPRLFGDGENILVRAGEAHGGRGLPVSGASLAGRRSAFSVIGFPHDWRGSVDSVFVARIIEAGLAVYADAPWNLLVHRFSDPAKHTWQVSGERFRRQGTVLGPLAQVHDQVFV